MGGRRGVGGPRRRGRGRYSDHGVPRPNNLLQQKAAAILVSPSLLSHSAAAAAEPDRSASRFPMASALKQLVAFVSRPNPAFVCRAAGRSEQKPHEFVAKICHDLNGPASSRDLKLMRSLLGPYSPSFEEIYAVHDGFVLYQDDLSEAAGVEALSIAEWDQAGYELREWLYDLEPENDPDHIRTGVAFATAPQSGNYFVVPIEGPSAGKVFYVNHDGWYEAPFAQDFTEFVARVISNPAHLLSTELGCYARYSDGKTETQWIPVRYRVGGSRG